MAQQDSAPSINPDDLMAGVKRRGFFGVLIISLGVHLVAIFGTSIGYIHLMTQHNSLHPRFVIKKLNKEKREQDAEDKRKAVHDRLIAEQAKRQAQDKGAKKGGPEGGDEKKTPGILKELEKTSKERPKESGMKMDELDQP